MKLAGKVMLTLISASLFFSGCSASGYSSSPLIKEIKNADNFQAEVMDCPDTVAVMFYTVACPTCRKIKPLIADLAEKWQDEIKIVTVNCRTNTDLVMDYEIQAVPRFIFFKGGKQLSEPLRVNNEDELFALFEKQS